MAELPTGFGNAGFPHLAQPDTVSYLAPKSNKADPLNPFICEVKTTPHISSAVPSRDTDNFLFTKYPFSLLTSALKLLQAKEILVLPMCGLEGKFDFASSS